MILLVGNGRGGVPDRAHTYRKRPSEQFSHHILLFRSFTAWTLNFSFSSCQYCHIVLQLYIAICILCMRMGMLHNSVVFIFLWLSTIQMLPYSVICQFHIRGLLCLRQQELGTTGLFNKQPHSLTQPRVGCHHQVPCLHVFEFILNFTTTTNGYQGLFPCG
jgi:hypothetical protein